MVSSLDLHVFSNISPSTVKNIKVQKNKSCSQSPMSSSTSSIRNTVSSSVPIVSDSLPTSPKLDGTPESINLKTKPKCEKPVIKHEYCMHGCQTAGAGRLWKKWWRHCKY